MLINKNLITAKTEEGIRDQVISQLREGGRCIVEDAEEARKDLAYNSERDAAEVELEEDVDSFSIEVENEDENGCYTGAFMVAVTAYYEDPGSNDYFYKVAVEQQ